MHYLSTLFGKEIYMFRTCEYSIRTLDDGQKICPKDVEFCTK